MKKILLTLLAMFTAIAGAIYFGSLYQTKGFKQEDIDEIEPLNNPFD